MGAQTGLAIVTGIILALTALALRLLRRSIREKSTTEGWVALFFLGLATEVAGYTFGDGSRSPLNGVAVTVSTLALLAFVRRVFRPKAPWAEALFGAYSMLIASLFILPYFFMGEPDAAVRLGWSAARGTAMLWPFFECTAYHRKMRKRARLGLADPVVANRFLLWSAWTGGAAALPTSALVLRLLTLAGVTRDYSLSKELEAGAAVYAGFIFCALIVSAIGLWLSFLPPEAYGRWIHRRAEARRTACPVRQDLV